MRNYLIDVAKTAVIYTLSYAAFKAVFMGAELFFARSGKKG